MGSSAIYILACLLITDKGKEIFLKSCPVIERGGPKAELEAERFIFCPDSIARLAYTVIPKANEN